MSAFIGIIVDVVLDLSDEFIIHLIIIKIIIRCFKAANDFEAFRRICSIKGYDLCIILLLFIAAFLCFARLYLELVSMGSGFSPCFDAI